MRKISLLLLFVFSFLLIGRLFERPTSAQLATVTISGNKFMANGSEIRLRGISIMGVRHWPRNYNSDGSWSEASFVEMRRWGCNVIRILVKPYYWLNETAQTKANLEQAIAWAANNGMYSIIDCHNMGDPIDGYYYDPDWFGEAPLNETQTKAFWEYMAQAYGNDP